MANEFNIPGLAGRVLPPLPFPYTGSGDRIARTDSGFDETETMPEGEEYILGASAFGVPMVFPLRLSCPGVNDGEEWLLPVEPLITISGGNVLARRNVAKNNGRGSIKERWATDDYAISIEGLLTKKDDWSYPASDVAMLRAFCEVREPIGVLCPLFEHFGITRIVIEKYDFPFTKGPENQAYHISAFSDDEWSLFKKPL